MAVTREEHRNRCKEWRISNKERIKLYTKVRSEKMREYGKKWRLKNKDKLKIYEVTNAPKKRNRKLVKKYGITFEDREAMKDKQQDTCAICGQTTKTLHVDHCHRTKKVRGLLCPQHNMMIGLAKDSITILQSAIDYLKSYA